MRYDYDHQPRPSTHGRRDATWAPPEPDRVDTSRQESAGDGVTEFLGRCERRVKNIHCELVQLLQALGPQRWTMLLMLMLACAELFVPGLLLQQLRKAWEVTVSSTHSRRTVCARVVYVHVQTHTCAASR